MKHLSVGAAGHVDHGKTALVRALTGVETDRLKEEKERGMSIVLGFAPLVLPEGVIDFIDSPGHEKFVGAMIAGASGIDSLLLVIAATERIKPQTTEHFQLAELLGIKSGIIAVTKCDLVDEQQRRVAEAEIGASVRDSFLRNAPILLTSANSGEGIDRLRMHLAQMLVENTSPPRSTYFYMPIDRSFVMTGYGTVATGTLHGAPLSTGEPVEIVPRGAKADIRGIQVHGEDVDTAMPGWRTAVNLRGIKKDKLPHGAALATPGSLRPTNLLDVEVTTLPDTKPISRGQTVRLHFGTGDYNARVYPLQNSALAPGSKVFAQLRLSKPVSVPIFWRFTIRSLNPPATIGGGRILDTHPIKKSILTEQGIGLLNAFTSANFEKIVEEKTLEAGVNGRNATELFRDLALPDRAYWPEVTLCRGRILVHDSVVAATQSHILETIKTFHRENPRVNGVSRELLRRTQAVGTANELFLSAIEQLLNESSIVDSDALIRLANFTPEPLTPFEQTISDNIANSFRRAQLQPPSVEVVTHGEQERIDLYKMLVKSGVLIEMPDRASGGMMTFHSYAVMQAIAALSSRMKDCPEGCTVSEINQTLGTTRKYAIPLLEYLDAMGETRRLGQRRIWISEEKETTNWN